MRKLVSLARRIEQDESHCYACIWMRTAILHSVMVQSTVPDALTATQRIEPSAGEFGLHCDHSL